MNLRRNNLSGKSRARISENAHSQSRASHKIDALVSFAALLVVVAATATAILFVSCSGSLDATLKTDGSVRAAVRLDVPDALSGRVRQFVGLGSREPLFNTEAVRNQFLGRTSIMLVDASTPSPEVLTSVVWVPNIDALIADTSLVPQGMIQFRKIPAQGSAPAMRELSVSLSRENAPYMLKLFPGVDKRIVESLSPPALEPDPVSAAEYRLNLEQVIIGKKYMAAFDACAVDIVITVPRAIAAAAGGSFSGPIFRAKLPLFDLLTLEKPIVFSVRWPE
ncbi:MAG TPA: hypothetical protein DHU26_10115 [Spirochaetaceae bacterium]|nr:hypothetical protein [Spirochaetaceae bacterium]HCX97300.1 hypothetical protein [Spirochaetaceae bacterium]